MTAEFPRSLSPRSIFAKLRSYAMAFAKAVTPMGPGLKAIALVSLSFVLFRAAFVLLSPLIHRYPKPPDPSTLVPWFRVEVAWTDGLESEVMLIAVPLYLAFCALVALRPEWIPGIRRRPLLWALAVSPLVLLPAITNSCIFSDLPGFFLRGVLFPLAVGAVALILAYWWPRVNRPKAFFAGLVLWCLALSFNLLSSDRASIYDYSYFVGPALEVLRGAPVREIYQLYNSVLTFLFVILVKLELWAHQMHAVLLVLSSLWLVLYYLLARVLFRSRSLALLSVICIFVVRFAAVWGGPAVTPGVCLLRSDLWVLPFLVLTRFGVASVPTAAAFALGYVADDTFGLLTLFCYGLWLIGALVADQRKGLLPVGKVLGIAACFALAIFAEFALTGWITSPAGIEYSRARLGFIHILPGSAFWGLLWIFGLSAAVLAREQRQRGLVVFLFVMACIQLIYFYGRSHDHNLLVISGVFILIVFLALDRLCDRVAGIRADLAAGSLAIILSVYGFAGNIWPKIRVAQFRIELNELLPHNPLDKKMSLVGSDPRIAGGKAVFLSMIDAYLYHRFNLPDPGGRIPISGRVDRNDLVRHLKEKAQTGYTILVQPAAAAGIPDLDWSVAETDTIVQGLNTSPLLGDSEFVIMRPNPDGPGEVVLRSKTERGSP